MLENLKEVILNLEKSLNMLVRDKEVELLNNPEYLQAMKEVVQSINNVTRTLRKLEESCQQESEGGSPKPSTVEEKPMDASRDRVLKVVKKNVDQRRANTK